ncbi:hypothetical protein JM83_0238 [Gillisia sp. Hel_I_86]|nr:hypothetical protein JM83_0238 [Gillisia sp. Hel_I_86]
MNIRYNLIVQVLAWRSVDNEKIFVHFLGEGLGASLNNLYCHPS